MFHFYVQVVLAVLGCACASAAVQYTPEVAAARARFAQLYQIQAAAAAAAPDHHSTNYHQAPTHHHTAAHTTTKWRGPVAATVPAGLPGSSFQVADTAEVTAARNAFLAAYRAQVAATTGHKTYTAPATHNTWNAAPRHYNVIPAGPQKWTGPMAATVPAGVNGLITPVGDTPEVVAARNAFLNTYRAAVSATRPVAPTHHHSTYSNQGHWSPAHHTQAKWTGPMAATVPAGLPGAGFQVRQTADVASATAAFQRAYSAVVAATTGRRY